MISADMFDLSEWNCSKEELDTLSSSDINADILYLLDEAGTMNESFYPDFYRYVKKFETERFSLVCSNASIGGILHHKMSNTISTTSIGVDAGDSKPLQRYPAKLDTDASLEPTLMSGLETSIDDMTTPSSSTSRQRTSVSSRGASSTDMCLMPNYDDEDSSRLQPIYDIGIKVNESRYVDHTYYDFSKNIITTTSSGEQRIMGHSLESVLHTKSADIPDTILVTLTKSPRNVKTFPFKLFEILTLTNGISHIISWREHGRSFIVHDTDLLETFVLPFYYKPVKYKSFLRQLNLWGFKRLTRGVDEGSYYHPFFLRGKPDLLTYLHTFKTNKGNGKRALPNPEQEPNFYELAIYRPLKSEKF